MTIRKLNSNIYPEKDIKTAVAAYNGIARINVIKMQQYYYCRFSKCKYDPEETASEFCNYLIDLINTNHDNN